MTQEEAASMIFSAVPSVHSNWADIGAGSGLFTQVLQGVLPGGTVYALDKSPHMLWRLPAQPSVRLEVVEADFTQSFDLPEVEGMVMANALHYAQDPVAVLKNVLTHLKPGGTFILLEYDTDRPNPPWVPFPISWKRFQQLALDTGLSQPEILSKKNSIYGPEVIYAAVCYKA